jgi:putative methionine-R-sulfoxide reductase with GAF domain
MASRTGSVVLVLLGAVLLAASIVRGSTNAAYGVGLLVFGTSLVVVGVVLPRLRNAEVGPATGFKLTLDEDRAVSTGLAECEQVEKVEVDQVVAATRLVLASEVLGRVLAPDRGPLADALFHLYLYDEQRELLLPAFEGRPSPSRGWKIGAGAVGEAWATGEYVLVQGPEVSDETYGLTPSQQRRARDLAVVAAMPVPNASDEVIAVLAGSSVDAGSGLGSDAGFDAHLLLAREVARVLVDLLRWFAD